MRSLLVVVSATLFPVFFGGCGFKAPLYLPEDKPAAAKPRAVKAAPQTAPSEPVTPPQ